MTTALLDPLGEVIKRCAEPKVTRRSIALAYAFAIRQEEPLTFGPANRAILDAGRDLEWIKRRAWKYVNGEIEPGTKGDTP